jgi:hypothetical protein
LRVNYFTELNTDQININKVTDTPLVGLTTNPATKTSEKGAVNIPNMKMVTDLQLRDYFARPVLITTIDVGTYTGLPLCLFTAWKAHVASKLAGYKYFRGCCRVTAMYAGNPTATGTEVIGFYPHARPTTSSLQVFTLPTFFSNRHGRCVRQFLQLPHIQVNVEQKVNETICLPFPNNFGAIEIATGKDWEMNSVTLNEVLLNSGTTPNELRIEIYVSYEQVELFGPIEEEGPEGSQHTLSQGLSYGARIAKAIGSVIPYVGAWEKVLNAGSDLAASFGWARPIEVPSTAMITRTNTNFSYVSGQPDFSDRLCLNPSSSSDVSGSKIPFSTPLDTNIKFLVNKWGLVISNLNVEDDWDILPTFDRDFGIDSKRIFSPLAYISLGFKLWRGSIDVKFEFVSNALLRQRVVFYIVPPGSTLPTAYVPGIKYLTTLVDIVGRTEVIINVPFFSPQNFNGVRRYTGNLAEDTRLVLLYIGATEGQTGTPYNIRYNMYVKAGEDFELARPTLTNLDGAYYVCEGPIAAATFGEEVEDLLELMKRSTYRTRYTITGNSKVAPAYGYPAGVLSFGSAPTVVFDIPTNHTFMTWFGALYYGMTGGYRYKFVTHDPQYMNTVSALLFRAPNLMIDDLSATSNGDAKLVQFGYTFEIEVPNRSTANFTQAAMYFATELENTYTKEMDLVAFCNRPSSGVMNIWESVADDFLLRGFLCVPEITDIR